MIRLEKTNPIGASTLAPASRNGRMAPGRRSLNVPIDSGAPAYISTDAEVTRLTSECQLGNGNVNTMPKTNAVIMPNHGMPFLLTLPNRPGKYRFRYKQ